MKKDIVDDFDRQISDIQLKIEHINNQQIRLENYIASLELTNSNLEQRVQSEKDPEKRSKLYSAMRNNFETILNAHSVYKDYESVKSSYCKMRTDLVYKKYHLLEVEIRKLDARIGEFNINDMIDVMNSMNKVDPKEIGIDVEKLNAVEFKL